jgi:hypothetical protein
MTSVPETALPGRRRRASSRTGIAMAAEAATFALASAVHFGTGFTDAAIPELVIAAVLGAGSSAVLTQRPHTWGIAAGTTGFAAFGTIVGLTIIATGRRDVPDLTYHASILAALAITLTALVRRDGGAGVKQTTILDASRRKQTPARGNDN